MATTSKLSASLAAAAAAAAAVASFSSHQDVSYADGSFRFNPFSSSPSPSPSPSSTSSHPSSIDKSEAENPKGSGFDPEALERAAKALREINNSRYAKEVFEVMRMQETNRLLELEVEKNHHDAIQARLDIERQQKLAEEQRNLVKQQAHVKAQMLRNDDDLARKRMQTDHEAQRRNNGDLVKMQESSNIRKMQAERSTEEQIQFQQRQTDKEKAEIERQTAKDKAMAQAEANAHGAKLTEDHDRRMLVEQINGEKEKWLAAINTTFSHIGGGFRTILNDRNKLIMGVGGVTALAAGVYTTREGARVTWGYINRILGQPSLIRESSIARFPLSGALSNIKNSVSKYSTATGEAQPFATKNGFKNIILHPSLQKRIEHLARATANTKTHEAPFRNMMFYGPPGTGKTMVAREIARKSGLDYAMMTGGDVAPLGTQGVTKIHQIFDWAKKSRKGLLLFIDEADAFLSERNSTHMSEAQRSALNALLFRTGDQSRDIVLVLATNRPGDLDSAITDRIDEVLEFPLPGEEERFKLLNLYLHKYLSDEAKDVSSWRSLFNKKTQTITIKDLSEDLIREAAKKTEGFSGREIAKLMASVQATIYGRPDCVLDSQLFMEVVEYKVAEHHQRMKLAAEG